MGSGGRAESIIYILSGSALSLAIVNWWGALQALLFGILGGFGGYIGRWLLGWVVKKVKEKFLNQNKQTEK